MSCEEMRNEANADAEPAFEAVGPRLEPDGPDRPIDAGPPRSPPLN
jgi:hypothetical protein